MARANRKNRKNRNNPLANDPAPVAKTGKAKTSGTPRGKERQGISGSGAASAEQKLLPLKGPSGWATETWVWLGVLAVIFLYSYWPTLVWMVDAWYREPDYSHGWAVPLLAWSICAYRFHKFPGVEPKISWQGLSLIAFAFLLRFLSRMGYVDFLDAYSILPLLAGIVWCLLGRKAMLWSLPAILFLLFAVPLPFQAETMLSWQLQGVATKLSTITLRILGQPAVAAGHIIWIGEERLSVEQACSGLRIFVGMFAFAFYWAAIEDRSWADRLVYFVAAVPAAIFVNSFRIVLIGLLYQVFQDDTSRHWIHEISGIIMIFASFGLMWLAGQYWKMLYRPEDTMTAKDMLKESGLLSSKTNTAAVDPPSQAG